MILTEFELEIDRSSSQTFFGDVHDANDLEQSERDLEYEGFKALACLDDSRLSCKFVHRPILAGLVQGVTPWW